MNKINTILENKLLPLGVKLNNIRFLQVLRISMMTTIPFIIAGSFGLIILNIPYIDQVLPASFMGALSSILTPMTKTTLNLIGFLLAFLVGYNYSKLAYPEGQPIYCGLTTIIGFLTLTPLTMMAGNEEITNVISMAYTGSSGMFVALIGGYLIAKVYCTIISKNIKIKMPDSVPPAVSESFESLLPAVITLVVVCILNYILSLTPFGNIHNLITNVLQKPLMVIGTGLPALILAQGFAQVLWFLGLQGDSIVDSVFNPILQTAGLENLSAYQANDPLPYIITDQFRALFVVMAFMSLVIAVLIVSKSKRLKEVGKISALPALFCISEPIVFGMPIVMNPIIFIPWILCRPIFAIISYAFMYFGLCPYPTGVVIPWTTPAILSGFLSTNSIMGAVVQIICLVVGVLLFIPFVKLLDKQYVHEEINEDTAN